MKRFLGILLVGSMLMLPGCAFYRVTDPGSGSVYYTTEIKKERGGAISFQDRRTSNKVTIQNSEIEKISQKEFESKTMPGG